MFARHNQRLRRPFDEIGSMISSPQREKKRSMTEPQHQNWNDVLVQVGIDRDKAAFAALFKHFTPAIKSFLLRGGSVTSDTADELVQDTMIKVWHKSPSFSPSHASATTWIYTIARNTRIDWYRKQARQDGRTLTADDVYAEVEQPSPHATLVHLQAADTVGQHLSSLPPEQSEVLRLMYLEGMSGQQVADHLSLPLGTVKSRIRLALKKMRIGMAARQPQIDRHDT